jgi:GT2 family glycosyltransferase
MSFDRLVVIILHYRGLEDTAACLKSVMPQCKDTLAILLVDNASGDDLSALQAQYGTQLNVLRLSENLGWAGGNNAGIAWARRQQADAVCLLNNDTTVPPGAFDRLAGAAKLCGSCLMHPAIDYADPAEGVQLDPSTRPDAEVFPCQQPDEAKVFMLDYAYGACLLIPMAVFDRIGTFDERFFLQLEETDFYYRARNAAIPSLCLPSVRIVHAESRSFGGRVTPDKTYYIIRNSLLLAVKMANDIRLARSLVQRGYWTAATVSRIADKPAFVAILCWLMTKDPQAVAVRQGVVDFCMRRFGPRGGSPRQR